MLTLYLNGRFRNITKDIIKEKESDIPCPQILLKYDGTLRFIKKKVKKLGLIQAKLSSYLREVMP